MKRAGKIVEPVGYKTQSGVPEQPFTIEMTKQGALNRHAHLHELANAADGDYYATIESGIHDFNNEFGTRGLSVVILQQVGGALIMGLDFDIEYPKDLLATVPDTYPDFGVAVQQLYGSKLKDPYPILTGNKLTREEILQEAAYRVAVLLK
jgi:non-canonical (house-cleaning) NTP pyrophosphatase